MTPVAPDTWQAWCRQVVATLKKAEWCHLPTATTIEYLGCMWPSTNDWVWEWSLRVKDNSGIDEMPTTIPHSSWYRPLLPRLLHWKLLDELMSGWAAWQLNLPRLPDWHFSGWLQIFFFFLQQVLSALPRQICRRRCPPAWTRAGASAS